MQSSLTPNRRRVEMNIVDGFKLIDGNYFLQDAEPHQYRDFLEFYDSQVKPDPYSPVRDRAMIKLIYLRDNGSFIINPDQFYFQSYGANDTDGGKVRLFPPISPSVLGNPFFCHVLEQDRSYLDDFATRTGTPRLNISIHFIRYKAAQGEASYSSPVWLHLDDEPLVFIHLVRLTGNAIGADSVISGMDGYPSHVYRLENPLDTLIVDRMKKHAVTPLGSRSGTAYRDVMLVNLEADVQQQAST